LRAEFENAGHGCEIVPCRYAPPDIFKRYDLVGVAFPVYGFRPANNILDFIERAEPAESAVGFLLACCSLIPANSLRRAQKALAKKGVNIIAGITIRGEESWTAVRFKGLIIGRGRPDERDDARLRNFAREVTRRWRMFREGEPVPPVRFKRFSPWGLIGLITTRRAMRYAMLGKFLDEEKCTQCGLCAEICPTGAIRLQPYPVFGEQCMGCFGCVNLCPEEAISTPLTWGRTRYKGHRTLREAGIAPLHS